MFPMLPTCASVNKYVKQLLSIKETSKYIILKTYIKIDINDYLYKISSQQVDEIDDG